jgi:hypothetical protein
MHLVSLFSVLGHRLPMRTRFPTFLVASVWSRYGSPGDAAREFAEHYATFEHHASLMRDRWQQRWDEDLSRLASRHPSLARGSTLDLSLPAFAPYPALRLIPARLTWCRLRLIAMLNECCPLIFRLLPESGSPTSLFAQMAFACRSVLRNATS